VVYLDINLAKVAMWLYGYLPGYIDIQIISPTYLDIDIRARISVDIDIRRSAMHCLMTLHSPSRRIPHAEQSLRRSQPATLVQIGG
jgi:hypothetical protein